MREDFRKSSGTEIRGEWPGGIPQARSSGGSNLLLTTFSFFGSKSQKIYSLPISQCIDNFDIRDLAPGVLSPVSLSESWPEFVLRPVAGQGGLIKKKLFFSLIYHELSDKLMSHV